MIYKLIYNWHQVGDAQSGYGEDYDMCDVGYKDTKTKSEVKSIIEHEAAGEGDKWYCDVFFIDGTSMRVFNPNTIFRT